MPTLQCPKCKQPIEIKSMPADNRVKCGSCSAEFSLKAPAKPAGQAKSDSAKVSSEKAEKSKTPAASSAKPTTAKPTSSKPTSAKPASTKPATASAGKSSTSSATAEADDPFAAIDLNSLGKSKRVDLGVAPVQAGAMESPSGGMAPWLPGNAPAYVPISQADAAAASKGGKAGNATAKITPAAKKSNLGVTIAVIAVLVMMAGGSIVAAIIVASK